MNTRYDTIVIGAGPAGIACATRLAELGLGVLLLDEQARPGGQGYRNIEQVPQGATHSYDQDYLQGMPLVTRLRASSVCYRPETSVWQVEADGSVYYSRNGVSRKVTAQYIVVATGAIERPIPFEGWSLPGVINAGGATILAKEAGLVPPNSVVLAGSGPLLLSEAKRLIEKDISIAAILETRSKLPPLKVLRQMPHAARSDLWQKTTSILQSIKNSGIPHYKGILGITAHGQKYLEAVTALHGTGDLQFRTSMLLVHFGFIPNTHIFRLIGCALEWVPLLRHWQPVCNVWGQTSLERIFAVGDGARVDGAVAASHKGELTALDLAMRLGILLEKERDTLAAPLHNKLQHIRRARSIADTLFAPHVEQYVCSDSTIVCRCEKITAGAIRQAVRDGAHTVDEVKALTRCGMGACQGRICGLALAEIISTELGCTPDTVGNFNVRPPLKSISLAELVDMEPLTPKDNVDGAKTKYDSKVNTEGEASENLQQGYP